MTVADEFIATGAQGIHELRRMIIERGVDQRTNRNIEFGKQIKAAKGANPVAIFTPGIVEHIRITGRREFGAKTSAKFEVLDVESDVHCQPITVWPGVVRTADDGLIVEPVMAVQ